MTLNGDALPLQLRDGALSLPLTPGAQSVEVRWRAPEPMGLLWRHEGLALGLPGVNDALRLGCSAIGFTIYPGSDDQFAMMEEFRELAAEAKSVGLAVVLWSYPRGGDLTKDGAQIEFDAARACCAPC